MNQQTGKYFIIAGIMLSLIGVIIYLFHNKLQWFGRLPGDVRIEKENFLFFFPFVSMLVISLVLTLLVNIFRKFL